MADVSPIPKGCNSVNVYLTVKDAKAAIDFYTNAFGGQSNCILEMPGGNGILHAEVLIGNSTVMLGEENPQWGTQSPATLGGSPVSLHFYCENVDEAYKQAIKAGCTEVSPPTDMFWGDRCGKVADPFGYQWGISTHQEEVSDEEMQNRANEWMASMSSQ